MPDAIRLAQRLIGRLTGRRELFTFTRGLWGRTDLDLDALHARRRRLGRLFGTRLFSRRCAGIPGRVHVHDTMMIADGPEGDAHYRAVGLSAVANIEASLAAACRSWDDIRTCLDMGCGFGRVQRHLAARLDPRSITACDIEEEAVRFCAEEFGAEPLVSEFDLARLRLPRAYDLVWAGSLFTHIPPADAFALMGVLAGALNPGGVMVFTTQGPTCLEHLQAYGPVFPPREADYRNAVAGAGEYFSPYEDATPGYGITLYRRDHFESRMAAVQGGCLRLLRYAERGWDNHQDCWGFQAQAPGDRAPGAGYRERTG